MFGLNGRDMRIDLELDNTTVEFSVQSLSCFSWAEDMLIFIPC